MSIEHNRVPWLVKTNRHRNTDETRWGWIDGAPGNVCWSDNKEFNYEEASKVVAEHNEWLEKQTPIELRILEAKERLEHHKKRMEEASVKLRLWQEEVRSVEDEIAMLQETQRKGEEK